MKHCGMFGKSFRQRTRWDVSPLQRYAISHPPPVRGTYFYTWVKREILCLFHLPYINNRPRLQLSSHSVPSQSELFRNAPSIVYLPNPKRGLGGVGAASDLSDLSSPTPCVSSVLGNCGAQVSTTCLRPSKAILRSSANRMACAASRTCKRT